jgi:hypothetical protein
MFRVLLTRLLPNLFPSSTNRSRSTPHSFSYAGKGTNEWTPTHSGKGAAHEFHLSNISAGRSRALASEEYILQGAHDSKEGSERLASLKDEERERVNKGEGIKLTTTYGIKYDDDESVMEAGDSMGSRKISHDGISK